MDEELEMDDDLYEILEIPRPSERKLRNRDSTAGAVDSSSSSIPPSGEAQTASTSNQFTHNGICEHFSVFMSYRRKDSAAIAGRIYDRLEAAFGSTSVFMDINSIPLGSDFRTYVARKLELCHAVVAVIGPRWAGTAEDGTTRISRPNDLVRIELATALARNLPVIPVLIDGAHCPSEDDLPEDLKQLAYRNAIEVDSGVDFRPNVERLICGLQSIAASL